MNDITAPLQERIGKVGIFLGGKSRERPISLRSGNAVYKALKTSGFQVFKIDTSNGFRSKLKSKSIDFAFLALHGSGGEDGSIQAILRKLNIPYVGSDPKQSALAFNKLRAKQVFLAAGIPTPEFAVLTRRTFQRVLKHWSGPCVVKPIEEGSSIDVYLVADADAAKPVARTLLKKYKKVLLERRISGREYTVSIVGGEPLPVIEIRTSRTFYDYKAKYTKGHTDYLAPAPISIKLAGQLRKIALNAYQSIGLQDLARVDLLVDRHLNPYVLEINSIPGFTESSLLPKAARCEGIEFADLCVLLLQKAYDRQVKNPMGEACDDDASNY
jgi:D-alanine-D-alanine ligase